MPKLSPTVIMALFFIQPVALGGWLAMIPSVQADLDLSKATLALALLGSPIALLPVLQIAGRVIDKIGMRTMFLSLFPVQAIAMVLPFLAWNAVTLFLALASIGATLAFLEVGLNLYAGRYEKRTGSMIMSRSHGFWAAGLAVGAALATWAAPLTPWIIQVSIAICSSAIGMLCAYNLVALPAAQENLSVPRRKIKEIPKAVILIALGMAFVTMTEGAMNDWAAVHMTELYFLEAARVPGFEAGFAVTVFSTFLAGGRFVGDAMRRMLGDVKLARFTLGAAIVGLGIVVFSPGPFLSLLGFAFAGFGVSASFPLGVSAVASMDDHYEASNIAFMSTIALCGFLVGPPLIGLMAESFGLAVGLAALGPGLLISFYLAGCLRVER